MKNVERLWSFSFINACVGNFLLFFAFYLLVPIFPLYLIDAYKASRSEVGIILSSYTIAALLIRPISGFLLDIVNRKPVYFVSYFIFVSSFITYPLAHTVGLFLAYRIIHGFSFGFVTNAANSFVVDILPASRRGEGLGYFGVANNLAMAVGPMISLLIHDYYDYNTIFKVAIFAGLAGFVFVLGIKAKAPVPVKGRQPIALDRFFLVKGLQAGTCLLLMGIPYGMVITYIAIYAKETGINSGIGVFFSLMAIGLIASRLISGKMVDKGLLVKAIAWGTFFCLLAFFMLSSMSQLASIEFFLYLFFYLISLIMGLGYGMIFPAYNTLFVNLAPHTRRATASSTYMTTWDIGIGIGIVLGGRFSDLFGGLSFAFFIGAMAILFSLIIFVRIAGPHYERNKLE